MNERDFELGGKKFKLSKIDVFKQFHIVRRVAPLLGELLPAVQGMKVTNFEALSEDQKLDSLAKIASPVMMGLAKLSDADSEFVLFGLLNAVEVQQSSGGWAKVASGSLLMIQDFELPALINIAGRAFMYNLSGFFAALPRQN